MTRHEIKRYKTRNTIMIAEDLKQIIVQYNPPYIGPGSRYPPPVGPGYRCPIWGRDCVIKIFPNFSLKILDLPSFSKKIFCKFFDLKY